MGGVGEKIMVSALTGVMSPLIGKLTKLVEKEYAKFKGVRKMLESLTKELVAINAVLEKYAAMEKPDVQVKTWTKEVRELAYDIEDRIDIFTYHVDHEPSDNTTGVKRIFRKIIRKLKKLHHRHKFATEVQELRVLVNEVYERQKRYKLDEITSSTMHTEIDPRLPALYVEVEKLVGIEGPSKEIINQLIGEEGGPMKNRRLAIVGSGGSGKTTLANQVYQKIKDRFFYKAFVPVSQKPNMNNLLRELLPQIESVGGRLDNDQQLARSNSEQQLIDRLRAYLENNGYLIVIDDIWSNSAWEIIQCALPKSAHASTIITTTRINSVAQFCCTSDEDFVYKMKPLSKSDSEILFLKRTFDAEDKCPSQLEGIMNEILYKCDGLPLAIITIASLLASKPRRKGEWEIVRNSIGSIHEKDRELEVIDAILSLSYHDLPGNIKACLLYLSMFPEDYTIHKDYLVWKWIAEGFVIEKRGYTLEEVGETYFNELINRSLIQPLFMEYGGKASACRVHDIVLSFIVSVSIEENFVSILDGHDLSSRHGKIRRLSFRDKQEHAGAISQETMNLSFVRSLNLFGVVSWMPCLFDLQVLRVLDLEACEILKNDHLEHIGSLFQLRYLGLRRTNVDRLPVQIGKLEFLQSLDIRETRIKELPEAVVQLKRLVHLVGYLLILPDGFGNMEALQELCQLDGCNSSINFARDLQSLRQLRVLEVAFSHSHCRDRETRKKALLSSLCKLGEHNLRSLCIVNKDGSVDCFADSWCPPPRLLQKFVMQGSSRWFSRFPKWIDPSLLCDLTHLEFRVKPMEKEDLRVLGGLPALLVLHLSVKKIPKDGLRISRNGFRCLTYFHFHNRFGPGLAFEGGALPKLQKLDLQFHANKAESMYGGFGFGIRHLLSLNHLVVGIEYDRKHACAMRDAKCFINKEVKLLPNHPKFTPAECGKEQDKTKEVFLCRHHCCWILLVWTAARAIEDTAGGVKPTKELC